MKKNTILITGAAGYIGSLLARELLKRNYNVIGYDILLYGGDSILELLNDSKFKFYKADIRNTGILKRILPQVDTIVHLAAIVGDAACNKDPKLAKEVNLDASINLYNLANQYNVKRFIFASTCSNYGKKDGNEYVTEEAPLNPISLYAKTKVEVERYLLNQPKNNICKPVILRFSTIYGISPRMRFDLTVNAYTRDFTLGKEVTVVGGEFWRPYCHVLDLVNSIILTIEAPEEKIAFEVFNVGDTSENYKRIMIVEEIKKFIPNIKVKYIPNNYPINYKVSFEKIKRILGFRITRRVPDGIRQIKEAIENGLISNPYDPRYKNA